MTVGERLAKLRAAHGETLRQAAARTGVHYSTLARIERGESGLSSRRTLRKVAAGYGVSLESLLHGERPVDRFAAALGALPPYRRLELSLTVDRRLQFALRFVTEGGGGQERLERIAAAAGITARRLSALLGPNPGRLPAELAAPLCAALAWEGGVSATWLRWGDLGIAQSDGDPVPRLQAALVARLGERLKARGSA